MRKIVRTIVVVVLCLSMLFSFTGCAAKTSTETQAAANTLQTVLERGYLIVGTGSNNMPWHFKDDSGAYQGFDVEMGKILARALFNDDTKVEFVEQASDARIPNLLSGKVDICIQFMTISAERAQQIAFSIPYYTEGTSLMLSATGKYKTAEELNAAAAAGEKLHISVLQNAFAEELVATFFPDAVAEQYEEQAMVIQALTSGVVDAAAIDKSNAAWQIQQNPGVYVDSGISAYPQNYGMGMRPDDQVWINFVNTVLLDSMTGNNYQQYADAFTAWFGESEQLDTPTTGMPKAYRNNNN